MELRPACASDLPYVADLAARAMLDDELFAYICPYRHSRFPDFRDAFLRRLKRRLVTPGFVMIVADQRPRHSNGGELIRGYGLWGRMGSGEDAQRWQQQNDGWWHALERTLLNIENRYLSLVSPDRSVDPDRLAHYRKAAATDCFPLDAHSEVWYLGSLAVDPVYQRRGIGQQLIQWGLQQARRERVPAVLEASAKGIGLYERLGFRTVNTMELLPGMTIQAMIWQADTKKGSGSDEAIASHALTARELVPSPEICRLGRVNT